ncbi:MAG: T9SS type A sorting domain-containing protein, partial [Bacteroidales bacterium]|nr:T9SS type A sorting domain-containing protein [Bacteroidales bacterium]
INISVAAINGKIQNVKIVDVLGNEIKELNINSLSQNINISDLLKGIYMVVVNTTKATYSQKFIKE